MECGIHAVCPPCALCPGRVRTDRRSLRGAGPSKTRASSEPSSRAAQEAAAARLASAMHTSPS
eukprot:3033604-Pleurochrysis_carterae.AAC.2